jgi:hypothetical protein
MINGRSSAVRCGRRVPVATCGRRSKSVSCLRIRRYRRPPAVLADAGHSGLSEGVTMVSDSAHAAPGCEKRYGSGSRGRRRYGVALRVSQMCFQFFAHMPMKNRVPTMPEQSTEGFGCHKRTVLSYGRAHVSNGNWPCARACESVPGGKSRVRGLDRGTGADRTRLRARAGTRVCENRIETLRQRPPKFERKNHRFF